MLPNVPCDWEPIELRILKAKLASMRCRCPSCAPIKNNKTFQDQTVSVDWFTGGKTTKKDCAVNALEDHTPKEATLERCSNCLCHSVKEATKMITNNETQTDEIPPTRNQSAEKSTYTFNKTAYQCANMTLFDFLSDYSAYIEPKYKTFNTKQHESRVTFADNKCSCLKIM